jgi:hypothetical protein
MISSKSVHLQMDYRYKGSLIVILIKHISLIEVVSLAFPSSSSIFKLKIKIIS